MRVGLNVGFHLLRMRNRALKDQPPVKTSGEKLPRSLRRIMESKMIYQKLKSGEIVSKAEKRKQKLQEATKVYTGLYD